MDIAQYLDKHGLSQQQFADQIEVSPGLVWQWLNGRTRITAERAKDIERRTKGEIKCHELRPDVFDKAA